MTKNNFRITPKKNAFSLIEILIAVIIVGVVASIAFSKYSISVERSRAKDIQTYLYVAAAAQERYAVEHDGKYASTIAEINSLGVTRSASPYASGLVLTAVSSGWHAAVFRGDGSYTVTVTYLEGGNSQTVGPDILYALALERLSSGAIKLHCHEGEPGICNKLGY